MTNYIDLKDLDSLPDNWRELEAEKTAMWELFSLLMDFDQDFKFTAKELAKQTQYTKQELNKLLFRLYVNKALLNCGKTQNGASIYSLNKAFFSKE